MARRVTFIGLNPVFCLTKLEISIQAIRKRFCARWDSTDVMSNWTKHQKTRKILRNFLSFWCSVQSELNLVYVRRLDASFYRYSALKTLYVTNSFKYSSPAIFCNVQMNTSSRHLSIPSFFATIPVITCKTAAKALFTLNVRMGSMATNDRVHT